MKLPDRTLFMQTQNAIWALLKYECFPKFKVDYGKSIVAKLSTKLLKQIMKAEPETVELYEQFLTLTEQNFENVSEFKPTTLPNDEYDEHAHQNLPSITEVWLDRDLMLAFREYLYQQKANDSLSFYLDAVCFELVIEDDDMQSKAGEIFENFITQDSPKMISLDHDFIAKIEKNLKKPLNRNVFQAATESVYYNLEVQLFPEFLNSALYKACNDETIEFNVSDGGRDRSNTMDNYDNYVAMIRKRNRVRTKRSKKIGSTEGGKKKKKNDKKEDEGE